MLAETKLSNRGLGFLIIQAYSLFDMPRMYAMLIVLFVLAIGANALVGWVGGWIASRLVDLESAVTRDRSRIALIAALAVAPAASASALADDLLKLTFGQRGNWDTAITELGSKAGIFKKYGLELEMRYTSGSGETLAAGDRRHS